MKLAAPEQLNQISFSIANNLVKILRNEEHLWLFVMDQFDRMRSFHENAQKLLNLLPMNFYEVEYTWGKVEPLIFKIDNPGIKYLESARANLLEISPDVADLTIAQAYIQYCIHYQTYIYDARLNFAEHCEKECRTHGHASTADAWASVVKILRKK